MNQSPQAALQLTSCDAPLGQRRYELSRARRVVVLVIGLWVLNLFDLVFTITAHQIGAFTEQNYLARKLLATGPVNALIIYKMGLLIISTIILLRFRRHWLCELGCWLLLGVYIFVSFLWLDYFLFFENCSAASAQFLQVQ